MSFWSDIHKYTTGYHVSSYTKLSCQTAVGSLPLNRMESSKVFYTYQNLNSSHYCLQGSIPGPCTAPCARYQGSINFWYSILTYTKYFIIIKVLLRQTEHLRQTEFINLEPGIPSYLVHSIGEFHLQDSEIPQDFLIHNFTTRF